MKKEVSDVIERAMRAVGQEDLSSVRSELQAFLEQELYPEDRAAVLTISANLAELSGDIQAALCLFRDANDADESSLSLSFLASHYYRLGNDTEKARHWARRATERNDDVESELPWIKRNLRGTLP